jgi:type IV fimbrial biogenesis protein FimT
MRHAEIPMHGASHCRGFTLVELMVTLTIASIMLTLAAPSFQTFVRTNQVRTAADDMVSIFNFSRSEAIKRGWPVTVCKSANVEAAAPTCSTTAGWKDGWLAFVDADQNGTFNGSDIRLKIGRPNSDTISISGGTSFADYLTYLPTGTSVGSSGNNSGALDLCLAGIKRTIAVSATGRLRVDTGHC